MTEVTEWGRGLTGPFMKSLNLPGDTPVRYNFYADHAVEWAFNGDKEYHLPADHFVYTVLDYNDEHGTGFVPWAGGGKAPDDWDGGECLFECGACLVPHPESFEDHDLIIGYTRKEPATDDDSEYVRVKKMAASEWKEKVYGACSADEWARSVGIIIETPVERFKRENPGLTADELLAKALENNK